MLFLAFHYGKELGCFYIYIWIDICTLVVSVLEGVMPPVSQDILREG